MWLHAETLLLHAAVRGSTHKPSFWARGRCMSHTPLRGEDIEKEIREEKNPFVLVDGLVGFCLVFFFNNCTTELSDKTLTAVAGLTHQVHLVE